MPIRVLIVDDDDSFRSMAVALLTARGYRVVGEVATAAAARPAATAAEPEAILLDLYLPDGDGLSLAAELCADGNGPRVLLTSSDVAGVPVRAAEASGATGFVAKAELAVTDLKPYLGGT